MSNIVYVGTYGDVLGRSISLNDKKIGITTDSVKNRKNSLSNTKSPIQFVMLRAWKINGDAYPVEQSLHKLYLSRRIPDGGEWFEDEDDSILTGVESLMKLLNASEIDLLNSNSVESKEDHNLNEDKSSVVRKRNFHSNRIGWIAHQMAGGWALYKDLPAEERKKLRREAVPILGEWGTPEEVIEENFLKFKNNQGE